MGFVDRFIGVLKLDIFSDNGDVYFVCRVHNAINEILPSLSRHSNKSHIARAVLESVVYQVNEILIALELDLDKELTTLYVDGGMVNNNLLMQYQADISDVQIQSQNLNEMTAYGAALASFVYVNNLNVSSLIRTKNTGRTWSPNMSLDNRKKYITRWNKALEKAKNWL